MMKKETKEAGDEDKTEGIQGGKGNECETLRVGVGDLRGRGL